MRLEDFLSGWREHLDAPAADVVELRTSFAAGAFRLKGGSHVPLACLLR
jgi:hypothetical protein